MAEAVQNLFPGTQVTIGPNIENGFYYDIDLGGAKIGEDQLGKIEKRMNEIMDDVDVILSSYSVTAMKGVALLLWFRRDKNSAAFLFF